MVVSMKLTSRSDIWMVMRLLMENGSEVARVPRKNLLPAYVFDFFGVRT